VLISGLLCLAWWGCGGSEPVEVGLDPGSSVETFGLVNLTRSPWSGVAVRVTGDARATACFTGVVDSWGPGEVRSFPRCGDRTLVALTVDGREALFVFGGGTLYRKLGRREIPVRP
jgi:hypothetical protein